MAYDDFDCIHTMESIVYDDPIDGIMPNHMTSEDKELLVKYAYALFKDTPIEDDLHSTMVSFVNAINTYRFQKTFKNNRYNEYMSNNKKLSKKSDSEKANTLKKKAIDIIDLLDKSHDGIYDILHKIVEDPLAHLKRNPNKTTTYFLDKKQAIREIYHIKKGKASLEDFLKNLSSSPNTK